MTGRERDIGRKYPSGSKKRKQAEKRIIVNEQKKNSILKFVTKQPRVEQSSNCKNVPEEICNEAPAINVETNSPHIDENIIVYNDPSTWPESINEALRLSIIQYEQKQIILENYPKDKRNRSFSSYHYQRKLKNGAVIKRNWLMYSKTANKVYCYVCKIFCGLQTSKISTVGIKDWKHVGDSLKAHENSSDHYKCMTSLIELSHRIEQKCTIDHQNMKILSQEKLHWRNVLERIIGIIQHLAKNNLAFRGSIDLINTENNGNFLQLVELLGKFDNVMQEHIRRITNNEANDHYLGKRIQNELLDIMAKKVRSALCEQIKESKYFSIILDCTPDASHKEQLSVIIRYVLVKEKVTIEEHFMGFLTLESQTGEFLTNIAVEFLKNLNINLSYLRGQGYDNGANMSGKYKGVQARMLQIESRAFFSPCSCHSHNLLLGDAAKSSTAAMVFFGVVQRLYTFFSASPNRWTVLKSKVTLTLKPLCETRWECRYESVKVLRYELSKIEESLHDIKESTKDSMVYSEADSLIDLITKYEFILKVVIWHDILIKINCVSKYMQQKEFQIDEAVNQMNKIHKYMEKYRNNGITSAEVDAREIAEELNIPREFPTKRVQRKRRLFTYEGEDTPLEDQRDIFRIQFFNVLLDTIISCIKSRFDGLKTHEKNFGFLYNISNLRSKTKNILQYCTNLQDLLTDQNDKTNADIDAEELCDELKVICLVLPENLSALETLNYIMEKKLSNIYPNICIALQVALTIPVTVASAERSFSKLKLIKTFLRSTMTQDRLNSLAFLSIESNIAETIDYSDLIDEFSAKKARKVCF